LFSIWFKVICLALACFNLTGLASAGEIKLDFARLFFGPSKVEYNTDLKLLAQYFSDERNLFLISEIKSKRLSLLGDDNITNINGETYKIVSFNNEELVLRSGNGELSKLTFKKPSKKEPDAAMTKNRKPQNAFSFVNKNANLLDLKSLADIIGIPSHVSSQIKAFPEQKRSQSGRPGWLLDHTIPGFLLAASPFQRDDVILSINGVAVNNIMNLTKELQSQTKSSTFEVELERSGILKLIRIKL
jgi:type II secretory pathway component PulC